MFYTPNRWYVPMQARWLTRDPLGMVDGPNLFAYVSDNPVNATDPMGASAVAGIIWIVECARQARALADYYIKKYGNGNGAGNVINYLRHCIAQCHLTQSMGSACAQLAGWYHEHDPNAEGDAEDTEADTHNNKIGRQCGKEVCPASDSDIEGSCTRCCLKNKGRMK